MTTVVNPLTTPVPIFNRSGAALLTLSPGIVTGGSTQADAVGNDGTEIPAIAGIVVVLAQASHPSTWQTVLRLSGDFEVGDVVEVYTLPGSVGTLMVFPPSGSSIGNLAASVGTNTGVGVGINASSGAVFRKISSTSWMYVGDAP